MPPTDYDATDKFIKGLGGVPPPDPGAAPAKPAKPADAPPVKRPEPPETKGGGEDDGSILSRMDPNAWYTKLLKGGTRGGAKIGESLLKYGAYASPLTTGFAPELGEMAEQSSLGRTLHDVGQEPNESWWETAGDVGAQAGLTAAIPGFGAETMAARGVGAVAGRVPPVFMRGVGWVPGLGHYAAQRAAQRSATAAGKVAGGATKGAIGGALGDPEHPISGAAGGAMGGVLPIPVGKAIGSRLGRQLGRVGATEGAFYGLHHWFGLPYYPLVGPLVVWHSGPIGGSLRRVGDRVMDRAGRIVGHIPPGAMGYFTGPAIGRGAREAPEHVPESIKDLGRQIYGQDQQPGPQEH